MKRANSKGDGSSPTQDHSLPVFWIARKSKSRSGKTYYFNTLTGMSSWRHPGKGFDEESAGSRQRKSSESSSKASFGDFTPVTKKKKKKHEEEQRSPAGSESHSKKTTPSRAKSSKSKSKTDHSSSGADPELGSPTRARIFNWVTDVSNCYEPTEQGSIPSCHDSNTDFELPDCVADVVIQPTPQPVGKSGAVKKQDENSVGASKRVIKKSPGKDVPHLQIPKTLCNDEQQQGQASVPLTPFSPISTEAPPVIGPHSRQVPSTFTHAPVFPTQLQTPSMPMAVDTVVPSGNTEPSFPERSSSNACTTPPDFCATSPHFPCTSPDLSDTSKANVDATVDSGVHNRTRDLGNATVQLDNEDCEIGMDIDDEELEAQIRIELQEIRASLTIDAAKIQAQAGEAIPHSYLDTLYIILDTNVLLSHLKFVTELRDYPIQGTRRPTLVVPWIVMQELDSLKSDAWKIRKGKVDTSECKKGQHGVDILARKAIRFLHSCLEENHPRVRGQTLEEVIELMGTFPEECNDDQILHCCLLFQRKAENGTAVLFSNDQNLCSKAMINGVKAFNHQTLTSGLASMFRNNAVVLQQNSFKEYNDELATQRKLAEKRAKADDIICELQCVLREGLSVVVETEMRAAYDDLWEHIVYIKPPWTLKDLLQLLDKHWIAVFGLVLKRNIKEVVDELKKSFNVEKGNPGCLANSSKILEQARKLFDAFSVRSSYNEAITKCMAAVLVLQRKCQQYQGEVPFANVPVPVQRVIASTPALGPPETRPPATPSCNEGSNSGGSDENADATSVSSADINTASSQHPHEVVLSTFELIWSAVKQFSDQIFAALDYQPNTRLLEDVPKPTPQQAIQFLGRLCPCLACLVSALQNVLKIPAENEVQDLEPFEQLLRAVARFLDEILSSQSKVAVGDLFRFWQDQATRTSLIQGLCQLDRALAMLQHCASIVATS